MENVDGQAATQQPNTLTLPDNQDKTVVEAIAESATDAMKTTSNVVSEAVAPVAFTATVLSAGTALAAHCASDIAGQLVAEVPYIGPSLEPAARMLGAANGAAVGLHTAATIAQAIPSPRAEADPKGSAC